MTCLPLRWKEVAVKSDTAEQNQCISKATWPIAMQYATLGSVIGHEVGHAFSPNGIRWDAKGQYRDSMDEKLKLGYNAMKNCLVKQNNGFCPENSFPNATCVDGVLTIGKYMDGITGLFRKCFARCLCVQDRIFGIFSRTTGEQTWTATWKPSFGQFHERTAVLPH